MNAILLSSVLLFDFCLLRLSSPLRYPVPPALSLSYIGPSDLFAILLYPILSMSSIAVEDPRLIKQIKTCLDRNGVLDRRNKISRENNVAHVYATAPPEQTQAILAEFGSFLIEPYVPPVVPTRDIAGIVGLFLQRTTLLESDISVLLAKVPRKWSVYHPMVLFGSGTFDSDEWTEAFATVDRKRFFSVLREAFPATITHFAVNKPIIEQDVMRRPFNLVPLHGDFGPDPSDNLFDHPQADDLQDAFWCHVVQNGIYQTWAPRYTMFSRGNIKEKKRILDTCTRLKGQTVLDLYAGIGYFTLSYLANGATVMCWELNPWSIEGLIKGLAENGHKYVVLRESEPFLAQQLLQARNDGVQAFIFHESNEFALARLATWGKLPVTHMNLGLLPSLKALWPIVREVQQKWSTAALMAHVHENVHVDQIPALRAELEAFYDGATVAHVEKVKTFAPDVWHVVVDVALGADGM